jgi:hypothetical protein
MKEMDRKDNRTATPEPRANLAQRQEQWVSEAMRHLFAEVTARKRS